jgi:hypothetical protein
MNIDNNKVFINKFLFESYLRIQQKSNNIKKHLDKILNENEQLEEERIANVDAIEKIKNLENFIGSHVFGEDIGGMEQMYVIFSYGDQFPIYMHYKGKWYGNTDDYILDDGRINKPTIKHKKILKPSGEIMPMSLEGMKKRINSFMKKNDIKELNHRSVEPGEKN